MSAKDKILTINSLKETKNITQKEHTVKKYQKDLTLVPSLGLVEAQYRLKNIFM